MSTTNDDAFNLLDGFATLRDKIDLLPPEQQALFRSMVDRADRSCGELNKTCATLRALVDDLHLATKYAEFEFESTAREIAEARRIRGLDL